MREMIIDQCLGTGREYTREELQTAEITGSVLVITKVGKMIRRTDPMIFTISGGIVNATCSRNSCGIGAGFARCMNMTITISGGTVTATGYQQGPGIGAGSSGSCGDIFISGGTVTATASMSNNIPSAAAGIGTGHASSSCGNITITTDVTKVTATKGANAAYCIGLGLVGNNSDNFCGTITFDTQSFTPTKQLGDEDHDNSWTYSPEPVSGTNYGGLTLVISGNTWTLTPAN